MMFSLFFFSYLLFSKETEMSSCLLDKLSFCLKHRQKNLQSIKKGQLKRFRVGIAKHKVVSWTFKNLNIFIFFCWTFVTFTLCQFPVKSKGPEHVPRCEHCRCPSCTPWHISALCKLEPSQTILKCSLGSSSGQRPFQIIILFAVALLEC